MATRKREKQSASRCVCCGLLIDHSSWIARYRESASVLRPFAKQWAGHFPNLGRVCVLERKSNSNKWSPECEITPLKV